MCSGTTFPLSLQHEADAALGAAGQRVQNKLSSPEELPQFKMQSDLFYGVGTPCQEQVI